MFVHVPAAWMAMLVYTVMALASAVAIIFRHPLADVAAKTAAPIGAVFCFLALATGSLWGKPMWGAWWVWDARLTSMFVLFLLYLGYIAIWQAIEEPNRAAMIARIVALVGFINIPIVKFSVDWWNSLHQPASVFSIGGPSIATQCCGRCLSWAWPIRFSSSPSTSCPCAARSPRGNCAISALPEVETRDGLERRPCGIRHRRLCPELRILLRASSFSYSAVMPGSGSGSRNLRKQKSDVRNHHGGGLAWRFCPS